MQTKLRPGDIVRFSEGDFIVDFANESRARIIPTTLRTVEIHTAFDGTVTFRVRGRGRDISPCVEQELIVRRGGAEALREFLRSRAITPKATPPEKQPMPKLTAQQPTQTELL